MKDLTRFTVYDSQTLREVMSQIQKNHSRCVAVLNPERKVVGVFSEGDVLRALLSGSDPFSPVARLVRPNFQYLRTPDLRRAYDLCLRLGITMVPVVDEQFRLVEVVTVQDVLRACRLPDDASVPASAPPATPTTPPASGATP